MTISDDTLQTPLISIITVVRNDEPGLAKTRESILAQTFEDWEWIVVDGLSSDPTLNAVGELADDHRVQVISEKDKGLYDAMNKGTRLAFGKYVNFLNAGDVYANPDALAGCINDLIRGNSDILFTSRIAIYGAGDSLYLPVTQSPDRVRHSLPTSHQACFIRKSLQIAFPYRLDYKVSADYRCIAEIAHSGAKLDYLDHITVISDQGAASTSFRHPGILLRECARTQREVFAMSRWLIWKSAFRRLLPMAFRRISAFIPGLSVLVRVLKLGT